MIPLSAPHVTFTIALIPAQLRNLRKNNELPNLWKHVVLQLRSRRAKRRALFYWNVAQENSQVLRIINNV